MQSNDHHINITMVKDNERMGSFRQNRRKSVDSVTSATNSCTSSADDADQYSYVSDHISFVSAITMDDALAVSDRLTLSDRYQYRLDPRLHSLAETRMFEGMEELEQDDDGVDDCSLPTTNYNRFTDLSNRTDTALCAVPCRRLSLSYRECEYTTELKDDARPLALPCRRLSASDRTDYSTDLEYIKSSSSELDLHSSLYDKSSATDLDYRSIQESGGDGSTFFLDDDDEEPDFDNVSKLMDGNSHPLHEGLDDLEDHFERVVIGGEEEPQKLPRHHLMSPPRRNYRKNNSRIVLPVKEGSAIVDYSRTGVASRSLDLLDIFGEERCH